MTSGIVLVSIALIAFFIYVSVSHQRYRDPGEAADARNVEEFGEPAKSLYTSSKVFTLHHLIEITDAARHVILAARDNIGIKLSRAYGKIRSVVCKRIMHFAECDAIRHHDVCRSMRAREKILDFLARSNEPLRYAALAQRLDNIWRDAFSLANLLHRLEGKKRVDALMDEIHHDIVTCGNRIFDGTLTAADEILRIPQPYIRAVRKTGNTHEI